MSFSTSKILRYLYFYQDLMGRGGGYFSEILFCISSYCNKQFAFQVTQPQKKILFKRRVSLVVGSFWTETFPGYPAACEMLNMTMGWEKGEDSKGNHWLKWGRPLSPSIMTRLSCPPTPVCHPCIQYVANYIQYAYVSYLFV